MLFINISVLLIFYLIQNFFLIPIECTVILLQYKINGWVGPELNSFDYVWPNVFSMLLYSKFHIIQSINN